MDCFIVSGTPKEMKAKIIELDKSQDVHLIILNDPVKDIYYFCRELGYAHLKLKKRFWKSLKILNETIAELPISEADLPKIDPINVGKIYDLMMKVNDIFKKNDFSYWAACGTLLGTVRHQGLIPWDDDVDVAFFDKDIPRLYEMRGELNEVGLELYYYPKNKYFKIFFINGSPIYLNEEDGDVYPWKFPFLDLFPMIEADKKYIYSSSDYQYYYPNQYFLREELNFPLLEMPFGPTSIPVGSNFLDYLRRSYGSDWNDVAYVEYNHQYEQLLRKIKVNLVEHHSAPYLLPY